VAHGSACPSLRHPPLASLLAAQFRKPSIAAPPSSHYPSLFAIIGPRNHLVRPPSSHYPSTPAIIGPHNHPVRRCLPPPRPRPCDARGQGGPQPSPSSPCRRRTTPSLAVPLSPLSSAATGAASSPPLPRPSPPVIPPHPASALASAKPKSVIPGTCTPPRKLISLPCRLRRAASTGG
jgi:hypothetical protein